MAKHLRALWAGSGGIVVAHGAALRMNERNHGQYGEQSDAERSRPECYLGGGLQELFHAIIL